MQEVNKKDTIWFLISCGWAVMNYIISDFIKNLPENENLILFLPQEGNSFGKKLNNKLGLNVEYLDKFKFNLPLSFITGSLVNADNYQLGYWDPYYWKWYVSLNPKIKKPLKDF